jgi:hypothetical protein
LYRQFDRALGGVLERTSRREVRCVVEIVRGPIRQRAHDPTDDDEEDQGQDENRACFVTPGASPSFHATPLAPLPNRVVHRDLLRGSHGLNAAMAVA